MNEKIILQNLEKLIAFEAVARLGSLHRASLELHISQPSLSVKIRTVEELLGVTLLERNSRGVTVTEKGEKLLHFCRDVIRLSQELQFELLNEESSYQGFIRLGVYDSIARYLWPQFHGNFAKAYPQLKLQLTSGRSSNLITQLTEKKIDLSITVEPPALPSIVSWELYTDQFSIFIDKKLALKNGFKDLGKSKFRPSAESLKQMTLISFSSAQVSTGRQLIQELQSYGLTSEDVMLVESFEIAMEFCLKRLGMAVLPTRVARENVEAGKLVKLCLQHLQVDDFVPHKIYLSMLQENAKTKKIQLIHEELKKFIKTSL